MIRAFGFIAFAAVGALVFELIFIAAIIGTPAQDLLIQVIGR